MTPDAQDGSSSSPFNQSETPRRDVTFFAGRREASSSGLLSSPELGKLHLYRMLYTAKHCTVLYPARLSICPFCTRGTRAARYILFSACCLTVTRHLSKLPDAR